ncbi:MAG: BrnT family toxin [Nitrospiraceae bacterium]|nr:BrnT family toxin [Nitrospiraceae bacterium]
MNEEEIIARLGIHPYDFRLVFGRTRIEYDPDKENENRRKHGYSLESAVYLFEKFLLPINCTPFISSDPFEENGEIRHMHMGIDDDGHVVLMVSTMRPDETVRIISFRRANKNERAIFYKHTGYHDQASKLRVPHSSGNKHIS